MKCEICEENFAYEDEMFFYDINGDYSDLRERATANPDNKAYQVCQGCDIELGGFIGVQEKLGVR